MHKGYYSNTQVKYILTEKFAEDYLMPIFSKMKRAIMFISLNEIKNSFYYFKTKVNSVKIIIVPATVSILLLNIYIYSNFNYTINSN